MEETGWLMRRIDDVPSVPWSNGGGTTREIIGYAESATLSPGLARWRLSLALLEHAGAFSPLPSIDRTFLLVGGEAALSIDGVVRALTHGDVVRFTGDQDVALESVTPGSHAVNLMVERRVGAGAPRLVRGLDKDAGFVVALASTPDVAQFDLLALGEGAAPRVELPDDLASLVP
jgi:environmental stress-induced protein Ves